VAAQYLSRGRALPITGEQFLASLALELKKFVPQGLVDSEYVESVHTAGHQNVELVL